MSEIVKKKHPSYDEMVKEAFMKLNVSRNGASRVSISNYIIITYELNKKKANKFITNALKEGVESGQFIQVSGSGANGSFKLSDELKKEKKSAELKAVRAEKKAEKDKLKAGNGELKAENGELKAAKKSLVKPVKKNKVDIRKSGISFKKINTKKLQVAAKLIQENKIEKPKKGEKLHVSILIKPKTKKTKAKTIEINEEVKDESETGPKTSSEAAKKGTKTKASIKESPAKKSKSETSPAKKASPAKKSSPIKKASTQKKVSPEKKAPAKKAAPKKAKK
jgi:hypothetical protein